MALHQCRNSNPLPPHRKHSVVLQKALLTPQQPPPALQQSLLTHSINQYCSKPSLSTPASTSTATSSHHPPTANCNPFHPAAAPASTTTTLTMQQLQSTLQQATQQLIVLTLLLAWYNCTISVLYVPQPQLQEIIPDDYSNVDSIQFLQF